MAKPSQPLPALQLPSPWLDFYLFIYISVSLNTEKAGGRLNNCLNGSLSPAVNQTAISHLVQFGPAGGKMLAVTKALKYCYYYCCFAFRFPGWMTEEVKRVVFSSVNPQVGGKAAAPVTVEQHNLWEMGVCFSRIVIYTLNGIATLPFTGLKQTKNTVMNGKNMKPKKTMQQRAKASPHK